MKVTVLIPTYRRPKDLIRCLGALTHQSRPADEIIVVARVGDDETRACLAGWIAQNKLPIHIASLAEPGQVAALNRGLVSASGDIIAITDDDAAPREDWVERIVAAFSDDARLGALGGRDWVHQKNRVLDGRRLRVGELTSVGKVIGNHHLGVGAPREVDVLKGANMSYRRAAICNLVFDSRLRGSGAQVHNDMAFSISVKRAGWKVVYDPRVAVDHFPAERFDERRDTESLASVSQGAYNLHLILRDHLSPLRREVAWWWYAIVGTRAYPGLLHALLAILSSRKLTAISRWRAVRSGARDARRRTALS